jgi:glycosyltransferase involved in cell wall biosynthesis
MRKILIVTDAWPPQVNGIITSVMETKRRLEDTGFNVHIIHPRLFFFVPLFFIYPEIKLALFARRKVKHMILSERPDYIHIVTEGPLGLAARAICVKYRIPFTTSYHTHLPLYVKVRIGIFYHMTYRYLRWFHRPSMKVMVSTQSLKKELEAHRFERVVVCPLGIDTDIFKKNPHSPIVRPPPKPDFRVLRQDRARERR